MTEPGLVQLVASSDETWCVVEQGSHAKLAFGSLVLANHAGLHTQSETEVAPSRGVTVLAIGHSIHFEFDMVGLNEAMPQGLHETPLNNSKPIAHAHALEPSGAVVRVKPA
jgi:pyridoxine 5'-phosphate synthase PdxJ